MQRWKLRKAKNGFSHRTKMILAEYPLWAVLRGADAAMIIAASTYPNLQRSTSLLAVLNDVPLGDALDVERSREPVREAWLGW